MFAAANDSSDIPLPVIRARNAELEEQLQSKHLRSIDVAGDGNCFFRAVSMNLFGSEDHHSNLRQSVTSYMVRNISSPSSIDDMASCKQRAQCISQDGVWIGEDTIPITASYLQRDIHVYIATKRASPLVYSSGSSALPPVLLAFFEPGHYRAVATDNTTSHLNR